MSDSQQKKRYADLAAMSRRQGRYCYTGFLAPAEAADARAAASAKECRAFGGTEECERVIIRYGDPEEIGYEEPFPLCVLKIEPLDHRFAEELTHRDFLGALMHLGLEREVFGDMLVRETAAYVFAAERMADYICRELTQVKHTPVQCAVLDGIPDDARPKLEEEQIIVSSLRLDNILAKTCHLSRTRAKELFAAGHVQIGGRMCEKESVIPQTGDIISVRGYGKFRFGEKTGETKKGSSVVKICRYI